MSKELLFSITKKDFTVNYFSGTGAGGQYRNKHQNCVRLKHNESGAIVTGQSNRERPGNMKEAINNMLNSPKFKVWYNAKIQECLTGRNLEEKVKEMLAPENIVIEGRDEEGRWRKIEELQHQKGGLENGKARTG